MAYDYNTLGNFKKYYNQATKANIWVLGYYDRGISDSYEIAKDFAIENNVPLDSVKIDEILESRRFKGFKFIFSPVDQELGKDIEKKNSTGDIFAWLTD